MWLKDLLPCVGGLTILYYVCAFVETLFVTSTSRLNNIPALVPAFVYVPDYCVCLPTAASHPYIAWLYNRHKHAGSSSGVVGACDLRVHLTLHQERGA